MVNVEHIDHPDDRSGPSFDQHPLGVRLDNVMHACPICDILHPQTECPVCYGAGQITAGQLDLYVSRHNEAMRTGTNPHRLPM